MDSFDRQWQRWFPQSRGDKPVPPARHGWTTARVSSVLAGALTLLILINISKGIYTEWLWFSSLGYGSVYATILKTKVLLFFSAAIIFCVFFLGNLVLATRLAPKTEAHFWPWAIVRQLQQILKINLILGRLVLPTRFSIRRSASMSSHCLSCTYSRAGL